LDNSYYIYAHINPTDLTVFYIGKGKGNRITSKQCRSIWWHRYIDKYDYCVCFVEEGLTEKEAFEKEIYYIKFFGRKDLGEGSLINMSDGGAGGNNNKGRVFSEEVRRKMSESRKKSDRSHIISAPKSEETRRKLSEKLKGRPSHRKGKKLSQEHREKTIAALTGRKQSPETIAKRLETKKRNGKRYNISPELKAIKNKRQSERMSGAGSSNYGKHLSDETKNKLSLALKNLNNKTCPYCSIITGPGNIARHHGEKCKHKLKQTAA
jgi:hypothetical protein